MFKPILVGELSEGATEVPAFSFVASTAAEPPDDITTTSSADQPSDDQSDSCFADERDLHWLLEVMCAAHRRDDNRVTKGKTTVSSIRSSCNAFCRWFQTNNPRLHTPGVGSVPLAELRKQPGIFREFIAACIAADDPPSQSTMSRWTSQVGQVWRHGHSLGLLPVWRKVNVKRLVITAEMETEQTHHPRRSRRVLSRAQKRAGLSAEQVSSGEGTRILRPGATKAITLSQWHALRAAIYELRDKLTWPSLPITRPWESWLLLVDVVTTVGFRTQDVVAYKDLASGPGITWDQVFEDPECPEDGQEDDHANPHGWLQLPPRKTFQTSNVIVTAPLNETLRHHFDRHDLNAAEYERLGDAAAAARVVNNGYTPKSFSTHWKLIKKRAGVPSNLTVAEANSHKPSLRKTCATMLSRTIQGATVSAILGHSLEERGGGPRMSDVTREHYIASIGDMIEVINAIDYGELTADRLRQATGSARQLPLF